MRPKKESGALPCRQTKVISEVVGGHLSITVGVRMTLLPVCLPSLIAKTSVFLNPDINLSPPARCRRRSLTGPCRRGWPPRPLSCSRAPWPSGAGSPGPHLPRYPLPHSPQCRDDNLAKSRVSRLSSQKLKSPPPILIMSFCSEFCNSVTLFYSVSLTLLVAF